MIPLYLGVEADKISQSPSTSTEKTIVFNHRTKGYRGWMDFVSIIKELRNQRQDFKVFCSMIDPNGIQTLKNIFADTSFFDFKGPSNREDYIRKLSNCRFGFHGGSRWLCHHKMDCVQDFHMYMKWEMRLKNCLVLKWKLDGKLKIKLFNYLIKC